jgi:hypothetical protein
MEKCLVVVALIAVIPDLLMACSSYLSWSENFFSDPPLKSGKIMI